MAELAKNLGWPSRLSLGWKSGEMELSVKLLNVLAAALSTMSGHILNFAPDDADPVDLDPCPAIPKERREPGAGDPADLQPIHANSLIDIPIDRHVHRTA